MSYKLQDNYNDLGAFRLPEFCERFGISRTKAYGEMKNGRLKHAKVGAVTVITHNHARDYRQLLEEEAARIAERDAASRSTEAA